MEQRAIAVFGSSEPRPGDPAYRVAYRVGRLLAEAGHAVVTGGYGGVMEAASLGATEAGGRAIGVPARIFDPRPPNPHLTQTVPTADLYERTRELVERSAGFVVLPGKAGTLAELAWLWALERAGCLGRRPMVLLGDCFKDLLELLERAEMLEPRQISRTRLAGSPEEAVGWILAEIAGSPPERT